MPRRKNRFKGDGTDALMRHRPPAWHDPIRMIRTFVSLAKHQREAIPYEATQRPIQGFLEQGFEVTSSGHLKPNSLGVRHGLVSHGYETDSPGR